MIRPVLKHTRLPLGLGLIRTLKVALVLAMIAGLSGCASSTRQPPLRTVEKVDMSRYLGTWYVLANMPNPFETDCFASREIYNLRTDGDIDNIFECNVGSLTGKLKRLNAKAWVTNHDTNAEWKVRFFWPIAFTYLVVDLAPDYSYTVVGHPSRDYVWIMARQRSLPQSTLDKIYANLKAQGYDTSKILKVVQPE